MRLLLPLLVLAHIVLALGYATVTPWRKPGVSNGVYLPDMGAPDEAAHANYVEHLLRTSQVPVLDPTKATVDGTYEAHQSPLFYALEALVMRGVGVTSVSLPTARLPMRGLNALIGGAGVLATFLLALWSTQSRTIAIAVASVVALLPMNAALSGAVSNDPLLITLSTFSLAFGARLYRVGDLRNAFALGTLAGLAFLTKTTGLLLLVTFPFFARERRLLLAAGLTTVVLIVPWMMRNVLVYGHPLATNAFAAAFPPSVDQVALHTPRGVAHWLYVLLAGTAASTVGEFGYMDIPLPYVFLVPILVLLVVGVVRGVIRKDLEPRVQRALAVFMALLIASFVAFNLKYVQPQARYLFPGIGALALWAVKGLPERRTKTWLGALAVLLVAANGYALATLPKQFAARAIRARSL